MLDIDKIQALSGSHLRGFAAISRKKDRLHFTRLCFPLPNMSKTAHKISHLSVKKSISFDCDSYYLCIVIAIVVIVMIMLVPQKCKAG